MPRPILIVDAFTDRPFSGNPAAVCLLDGPADASWMQAVAAEMAARLQDAEGFNPLCALPEATAALLFSESNSRFLCEVPADQAQAFELAMENVPCALIGEVVPNGQLQIVGIPTPTPGMEPTDPQELAAPLVIDAELAELKEAWQSPLRW